YSHIYCETLDNPEEAISFASILPCNVQDTKHLVLLREQMLVAFSPIHTFTDEERRPSIASLIHAAEKDPHRPKLYNEYFAGPSVNIGVVRDLEEAETIFLEQCMDMPGAVFVSDHEYDDLALFHNAQVEAVRLVETRSTAGERDKALQEYMK